jgi:hypothetical protein
MDLRRSTRTTSEQVIAELKKGPLPHLPSRLSKYPAGITEAGQRISTCGETGVGWRH